MRMVQRRVHVFCINGATGIDQVGIGRSVVGRRCGKESNYVVVRRLPVRDESRLRKG